MALAKARDLHTIVTPDEHFHACRSANRRRLGIAVGNLSQEPPFSLGHPR